MAETQGCVLFDWGDTLMRVFPEHPGPMSGWPKVEIVPGAREALAQLKPQWTLALATNAQDSDEADIRAALARVDLDQLLDRVYCFRRIGHKKPSAEFFAHILNDLRMDAAQVVMVGDDFERDILAANAFGIRAIWLNARSGESKDGPMFNTIHALADLPAALGRMQTEGNHERAR